MKYKEGNPKGRKASEDLEKLMNNKRYLAMGLIALLVVIPILTAYSASTSAGGKGDVVARVDNEDITKEELYETLVAQNGQAALETLISKKIIELEIEKNNISITEDEIQEELDQMIEAYGGQEEFDSTLAYYGYTVDGFKTDIKMNQGLVKLVEPMITITEEEMKSYFEENKDDLGQKEQVKASHILVESQEEALEIKEKLSSGEDFSALAKEHSMDTGTKEQGGALGFFEREKMVEAFSEVAFSLEVGTISDPVKTEFGYHIIQVEEKKEAKEANYEESKEAIKDHIFQEKLPTAYSTWIEEKYGEYNIESFL